MRVVVSNRYVALLDGLTFAKSKARENRVVVGYLVYRIFTLSATSSIPLLFIIQGKGMGSMA